MASQANYFGQQPPPPIKKGNTPSTTTTESSSSSTKNGVKTTETKYITTSRTPADLPDKDTDIISKETREYNDGTVDDITLTEKVLGKKKYEIETIVRTQTKDVGSKKTKTTYATPYQELDPVTGKPINAFKRVTHTGDDHAKAPAELAEQIALRAPEESGMSHNVQKVTTGPGAPPAPAPAPEAAVHVPAPAPAAPLPVSAPAPTPATSAAPAPASSAPAGASTGGGGTTSTTATSKPAAAPAPAPTTTTTVVVEEAETCCTIL